MAGDDVTQPELADVVALLLAHLRRDQAGAVALVESLGAEAGTTLVSQSVTMALDIAVRLAPGGRQEVEELLTSWQRDRRQGL